MKILLSILLLSFLSPLSAQEEDPAKGPVLEVGRGRSGDDWVAVIKGPALATGLLGIDLVGAEVQTPGGVLGLGLSDHAVIMPFTLDDAGRAVLGARALPNPALDGVTFHVQAGIHRPGEDPSFRLASPLTRRLHSPRVLLVQEGPSEGGAGRAALSSVDALTAEPRWHRRLEAGRRILDVAFARDHDLLFVATDRGLVALDDRTGEPRFERPQVAPALLLRADSGELLLATRTHVVRLALPGGEVVARLAYPKRTQAVHDLVELPARPAVLLRTAQRVHVVDLAADRVGEALSGVEAAGGWGAAAASGTRCALLDRTTLSPFGGGADTLHMLDLRSFRPVLDSPLALPTAAGGEGITSLAATPGRFSGDFAVLLNPEAPRLRSLEVAPLRLGEGVALPQGCHELDASAGAREWLTLTETGRVLAIDRGRGTASVSGGLPETFEGARMEVLHALDSAGLRFAFVAGRAKDGSPLLYRVATDPLGALTVIPLEAPGTGDISLLDDR